MSETDIPEIELLILLSQQIKWQATGDNGEIKILLKHNIFTFIAFHGNQNGQLYFRDNCAFKKVYSQMLVLSFV